jgi:hypothetical protein
MILFADATVQTHRLANLFIGAADPMATESETTHGGGAPGTANRNVKPGSA